VILVKRIKIEQKLSKSDYLNYVERLQQWKKLYCLNLSIYFAVEINEM